MKRAFLFISGLHRDMAGVTICNTRHDQIKICSESVKKCSLTSLPPLLDRFICCGDKKIWLPSTVFFRSSVSVSTTSTRWSTFDNVIFSFFIIVCYCNNTRLWGAILSPIHRGRFCHGCGLKASAPQLCFQTIQCWLASHTGWAVVPSEWSQ